MRSSVSVCMKTLQLAMVCCFSMHWFWSSNSSDHLPGSTRLITQERT
jgi:hypothetical protein